MEFVQKCWIFFFFLTVQKTNSMYDIIREKKKGSP